MVLTIAAGSSSTTRCCDSTPSAFTTSSACVTQIAPASATPSGLRITPTSTSARSCGSAYRTHALADLLQSIRDGNGTADRDHGITFRVRGGESGHEIRAAGPGGDQRHARFPRHAPDATGDERRILLVAADDRLDSGVQQRVEHLVDLHARDAEDVLDTLRFQTLHQQVRSGWRAHFFSPSAFARSAAGSRRRSAFRKSSVSGSAMW